MSKKPFYDPKLITQPQPIFPTTKDRMLEAYERVHDTDSDGGCWCEPEYFDGVWIHRTTDN